ncbi:hypothetical protein IWW47_002345 [Coemansia sp. RSA 2052]|nr:hypothetical protein IWW47_002345 [Coemansia sp. RSA 2052]
MAFMASNRENVAAMASIGIDIGTFSLGYLSITFLLFFYAYFLMQLFAELGKSGDKTMTLPTADDGTVYHSVGQGAEEHHDAGNTAHSRTHVIFDAGDDEYDGDDDNGLAHHRANIDGVRGRNAGFGTSPRGSTEIELSPMRG